MQLKKLTQTFYDEHTELQEVLDNHNGQWTAGKTRGYGVVIISLNDLTFAIPLRTNIKHKASYITVRSSATDNRRAIRGKGLDYSKALLISDNSYISNHVFKIPNSEHTKLQNKQHHITERFERYVNRYIGAVKKQDNNILRSPEYRFTTLVNYHSELNI